MNDKLQFTELEKTVSRLKDERSNRHDIYNALHNGIILFKQGLAVHHINTYAKQLLVIDDDFDPEFTFLPIFKNKKATLPFKLHHWLQFIKEYPSPEPTEITIWLRNPQTLKVKPLLLSAKAMLDSMGRVRNVLLAIYDRSVHAQVESQQRLMEAAFNSYNGQFIANEHGFIIKANDSFIALSGIDRRRLNSMTLMQWLEQQIDLKNDTTGLLKTLIEHKFWSGEVELHPSEDTIFHAILSISMVIDEEFNIEHYIVNLQSITDIKEAHAKLEHMAYFDTLTGLPNRKQALQNINTVIAQHRRKKTFSALLCINLERFKGINDAFGRRTGDKFLVKVSEAIQRVLRPNDKIARLEGDEFVIISQDSDYTAEKAAQSAHRLALKVSHILNHHFDVEQLTLNSSVRIGIVVYPGYTEESPEDLLINADLAVAHAKDVNSQHKIFTYDIALTEQVKYCRELESDLVNAHNRNEIELYYQAQLDKDKNLYGAEVLARWHHPKHGWISPCTFIEIAEDSRQILKLGAWIMYRAFLQAKIWQQYSHKFHLSVNISPIQFHEADFIENVRAILNETQVNPNLITMELTEGILVSDIESAVQKIGELREIGFKVSIDDFGTGYSSLTYFQKLPIHELKIDKSFIGRIPESKADIAIVESIIRLAQAKDLIVVAEGVETEQQVEFIQQQKDDVLIQGFFFNKPCSADEFENTFFSQAIADKKAVQEMAGSIDDSE
ncbi:putative bifunctional diguanylate cyclase/phosphodiesterase [Thiomicrorhabdus sediminis]|uniref:EAL domain-containing protein n=1 Tax=Thiomicrorhabdus sediminis TaxID=2580412 RepID=A0A4P9K4W5_9GAMM|nr:EAL domain-containing protein [Thiomicrorhabdus sediminis]QCU89257.1 EAL domain-containing protein [Thiomicrorhabdus sediminis]